MGAEVGSIKSRGGREIYFFETGRCYLKLGRSRNDIAQGVRYQRQSEGVTSRLDCVSGISLHYTRRFLDARAVTIIFKFSIANSAIRPQWYRHVPFAGNQLLGVERLLIKCMNFLLRSYLSFC